MTDRTDPPRGRGRLALTLQEAFTVAVRLRANRQVAADSESFRAQIRHLLSATDRDARALGYDADTVRLAIYAYIAFLDESVLNSSQSMFAAWSGRPLQEEIFGDNIAGENFFKHLGGLLARQDSEALADLLEVFQLCLLLGFRGKYASNPAGLRSVISMVEEKIDRIRGGSPPVGPDAPLPAEAEIAAGRDPWLRRLAVAATIALVFAAALWAIFRLSLSSDVDGIRTLSASLIR